MPLERKYYKVEQETGEILESGTDLIYTEDEISKQQALQRFLREKTEFEDFINGISSYSFLFYNHLKKIDIANEIKTRFIFLTAYIKYGSKGLLVDTDKERSQIPLDRTMLKEKLKLQETAFIKTINTLKENDLIKEKHGLYYLNSKFVIKGELPKQKTNQPFSRIFADTIKELYKNCTVREQSQLYYFFALLPLTNYKYNCVCHNPQETEIGLIKKMDIKDICYIVGYNPKDWKKFWNNMQKFKIGKEHTIVTSIRGGGFNNLLIKVNPKLYYAGTQSCFEELKLCCYEFFIEE